MPTLSLTQTIERQLELFNRICNSSTNIKKVSKDNITRELLEAKLQISEKNWKEFQKNTLLSYLRNLKVLTKVIILSMIAMV